MHELMTIELLPSNPQGLGKQRYKEHPRIGEWVEIEIDGEGVMFEVVMVGHSAKGSGAEIYVRRRGPTDAAIRQLCQTGDA